MKVAHLIITYTNPAQTERMIKRMWHPDFDFYVHVDAKLPISSHDNLISIPNVYMIQNRVKVEWAAYSTIQSEFNGIQEILESKRGYDFISLLSGQGYPIKSPNQIKQFYKDREGKLLLKYRSFQDDWPEGMERIKRYYLVDYQFKGQYFLEKLINRIFPKRKVLPNIHFYGSSMFWAISPAAAAYVLETVNKDARVKWFFKHTWAPDEFLFQTILLNSSFAPKVINENCHYYQHDPQTPNPKVLSIKDFNDIITSDRIYARKFNMNESPEIMDAIDQYIDQQITLENKN